MRRCIKTGAKVGISIITALCMVEIAKLAWNVFRIRTAGAYGGEILFLPLIVLIFYSGWAMGKEWDDIKKYLGGRKHDARYPQSEG